jgi:lysophospholipase L1-like esterase
MWGAGSVGRRRRRCSSFPAGRHRAAAKVVVILAGINDIAGNTGPSTQAMIADNLMSMTEIAKANGIRVVLSSVLPAYDFPWRPGIGPRRRSWR